ncbi:hypothetical protein [Polyangium sp. y55x31]|nr:hypothetical protein [Polyangium sp. y55x31]MDI1477381.1 hypothetical protein [Polyangium sp. y55x31]
MSSPLIGASSASKSRPWLVIVTGTAALARIAAADTLPARSAAVIHRRIV